MPTELRDDLLKPIAGANPSGKSLRYDTDYDRIKEARREDDDAPQGDWARERKTADFNIVIKLASNALAEKSKDLWLAAWLTEALLRKDGFHGLLRGLGLLHGLVSDFWDTLYPEIDDDDTEMRAAPLIFVGDYLERPLKMAPFTKNGLGFYAHKDSRAVGYEAQANESSSRREAFEEAKKEGKLSADDFDAAVKATPTEMYVAWMADLDGCLEALESLNWVCEEKFGSGGPSFSSLRGALQEVRNVVKNILSRRQPEGPPVVTPEPEAEAEPEQAWQPSPDAELPPTPPRVSTRPKLSGIDPADPAEATVRLAAIAKFLRQHDSADPAPYLMLRGYRWGESRRQGSSPDPSFLISPPTEVRQAIRKLAAESSWSDMLETAETAMAEPCGRAWMDLQRYTVRALEELGISGIAAAIKSELRALLTDIPELLAWNFDDDTPVANGETQAWLRGLLPAEKQNGAEPQQQEYIPPAPPPVSSESPEEEPDSYSLAMDKVRSGRVEEALEILSQEAAHQSSGRGRYQTKVHLAQICLSSGREALALPILEELLETIDQYHLDTWEAPESVAHTLSLLYRCLEKTEADAVLKQKIYKRICRLDPMQAIAFSR